MKFTIIISLHSQGIIHTNLKPSKILISYNKPNSLYISDFSRCFVMNENLRNKSTLIFQENEKMRLVFQRNANIFSGINIHHGSSPSSGDDFESLAYILLFLLKGGKWFLNDIENYELKNYEAQMRALTLYKLTTPIEKQCNSLSLPCY